MKRYDPDIQGTYQHSACMVESSHGDYVRFEDCFSRLRKLEVASYDEGFRHGLAKGRNEMMGRLP